MTYKLCIILEKWLLTLVLSLQWKEIAPDQLLDYKLKCVFETPRCISLSVSKNFTLFNYLSF